MTNEQYLFRGKNDDGEWVTGSYLPPVCGYPPNIQTKHSIRVVFNKAGLFKWHEVDPATIGQCTGIRDKNGALIFEGDFLSREYDDTLLVVVWHEDGYKTTDVSWFNGVFEEEYENLLSSGSGYCPKNDSWQFNDFEVAGNIHDNPELLNGADK